MTACLVCPGVPVFERFFRSVTSIQIDRNDVRRFRDFVDQMIDDIAIAGRNSARWNGQNVIAPQDLPITKGGHRQMSRSPRTTALRQSRRPACSSASGYQTSPSRQSQVRSPDRSSETASGKT